MKKINKQSGFTLIEILVVIGIIAILATIVLIAINPARQFKQARDTQRVSNVNAILNAIGQSIADNKGIIPTGIDATDRRIKKPAGATDIDLCATLVPKYLPSLPADPSMVGSVSDCTVAAYDVDYTVSKDANDRITVKAPSAEITIPIQVTR